ncbi:AEC family transporter [Dankookia rubra]|uniref:AEC family transporter n=1 Tax=Dankookia rubra TaxID=1442381 RepID=UPI0019D697F0|nr:AEC family transporter [Dankookia rubra]
MLSTVGIVAACLHSDAVTSRREIAGRIARFPPLLATLLALAPMPVRYPDWLVAVLHRLGGTLARLALVSVGLQLRCATLRGNGTALALGPGYKLVLGPLLLDLLYVGVPGQAGETLQVTLLEAAMAPQIGASIIAIQQGLNPPLVTLMVGIGTLLSFVTLPVW